MEQVGSQYPFVPRLSFLHHVYIGPANPAIRCYCDRKHTIGNDQCHCRVCRRRCFAARRHQNARAEEEQRRAEEEQRRAEEEQREKAIDDLFKEFAGRDNKLPEFFTKANALSVSPPSKTFLEMKLEHLRLYLESLEENVSGNLENIDTHRSAISALECTRDRLCDISPDILSGPISAVNHLIKEQLQRITALQAELDHVSDVRKTIAGLLSSLETWSLLHRRWQSVSFMPENFQQVFWTPDGWNQSKMELFLEGKGMVVKNVKLWEAECDKCPICINDYQKDDEVVLLSVVNNYVIRLVIETRNVVIGAGAPRVCFDDE
jgi:hypothetical protein